jgi:hypothetical protein
LLAGIGIDFGNGTPIVWSDRIREKKMLDHVTIGVSDINRSKAFYDQALRPLGIERLYAEKEIFAGYGAGRKAFFWIGHRDASQTGVHVAFTAPDRETVDRFTRPRSRPEAGTTVRRAYGLITMRIITGRSYSIRMATTLKLFVTRRSDKQKHDAPAPGPDDIHPDPLHPPRQFCDRR